MGLMRKVISISKDELGGGARRLEPGEEETVGAEDER